MKTIQIFDKKFPAPSDRHIKDTYNRYIALQTSVLREWVMDVAHQRLAARQYADFADARVRMVVSSNGAVVPVISIRPVVGPEVQEELDFYTRLFAVYAGLRNNLFYAIQTKIQLQGIKNPLIESSDEYKAKMVDITKVIHMRTALLKFFVCAANDETLNSVHLDVFDKGTDLESFNEIIRSLGIDYALPDAFRDGGNFYDHPDQLWISAFHNYVRAVLPKDNESYFKKG
jgi:hypothetical protein